MKDNLSIVITMLIFVILIVIFPLYNYFERQDDMSYNLALKATTNFVDEVLQAGYMDQEMYDRYTDELSNTGNIYDIQLEGHRKLLTKNDGEYDEQFLIDYNDKILYSVENSETTDLNKKRVKDNSYYMNEGDQFYVKLKNDNTTMAGAIFNTIVPTAKKERIVVNYGGVIKNQSWAKVDATYRDVMAALVVTSPNVSITDTYASKYSIDDSKVVIGVSTGGTGKIAFKAEGPEVENLSWWNNEGDIDKYFWKLTDESGNVKAEEAFATSKNFELSGLTTGTYTLEVKGHSTETGLYSDSTKIQIEVKKRVKSIIAEIGWDPTMDMDLYAYFTFKDGSVKTVYYSNKTIPYGTLSTDDTKGTVSSGDVDEYIELDLNKLNLNEDVHKIEFYVNCYSGKTISQVSNLFTNIKIEYEGADAYEENKFSDIKIIDSINSSKSVKMGTITKEKNGDWYLQNKELEGISSLPTISK